jgi:YD repeat-containing protein
MAYTGIDDPSAHFQATTYTGDGNTSRAVTNGGNSDLQPDWVWIKDRNQGVSHVTYDSSRGATKRLYVDFSSSEATQSEGVQAFSSDGFTLGNAGASNQNTIPFIAWQWHANSGTTSTNSSGATDSTVQVNTDAGFSIVTFTTTGSTTTFGHGLGVKPSVIISKYRSGSPWYVFTDVVTGSMQYGVLSDTNTFSNSSYNAPTSTVFQYNDDASRNHVAYCFAEKQGYSKFGKYTGNGNADGTFVHLGFKPALFICKRTDSTGNWLIFDNKRDGINPSGRYFYANGGNAEFDSTTVLCDFVSNGVKVRSDNNDIGASNATYIFLAFAENPFVTSDTGGSIPTTAR